MTSTSSTSSNPHVLPATTHSYLARAAESLAEAMTATEVTTRYACAHVAALRAAAALLAARARPALPTRRKPQKNAWVLLTEVAPELAEWAGFFAAGAGKRAAAEAGSAARSPSARPTTWSVTPTGSWPWSSSRSGWCRTRRRCPTWSRSRRHSCPCVARHVRPVRAPARRLGLLPALRRLASAHAGRAGRRAEMDTLALTDRDGAYGAVNFTAP